jgi:hypothetical protein
MSDVMTSQLISRGRQSRRGCWPANQERVEGSQKTKGEGVAGLQN